MSNIHIKYVEGVDRYPQISIKTEEGKMVPIKGVTFIEILMDANKNEGQPKVFMSLLPEEVCIETQEVEY